METHTQIGWQKQALSKTQGLLLTPDTMNLQLSDIPPMADMADRWQSSLSSVPDLSNTETRQPRPCIWQETRSE